jgi:hypothetical protein
MMVLSKFTLVRLQSPRPFRISTASQVAPKKRAFQPLLCNLQSAICTLQSALCNLQSALRHTSSLLAETLFNECEAIDL